MHTGKLERFPVLAKARLESERVFDKLKPLAEKLPDNVTVICNGSLARGEATSTSDFDAYILTGGGGTSTDDGWLDTLRDMQKLSGLKPASDGGAFGEAHAETTLLENIGGQMDDNAKFTRRMLFILESRPVAAGKQYDSALEQVVYRYVSDDITHHQIGRFLLNDIVRFYRTMCVDFEFKTHEQKKAWGTRNIKLIFSRKLMYFSGVVMCAELAERHAAAKRRILTRLIRMSPIERLIDVMGEEIMSALKYYAQFVDALDDAEVRSELEGVSIIRDTHTAAYRELKDAGHHFSWALTNALRHVYPPSHPIHDALVV